MMYERDNSYLLTPSPLATLETIKQSVVRN